MNDDAPNVVGASQAAEILGVEVPRITRWRKAGRMPALAADLKATPVWHRQNVEELRDDKPITDLGKLSLVSTAEAAELLGVDKSQVGRWQREDAKRRDAGEEPRHHFPEPVAHAGSYPLWERRQIAAFKRSRTRAA